MSTYLTTLDQDADRCWRASHRLYRAVLKLLDLRRGLTDGEAIAAVTAAQQRHPAARVVNPWATEMGISAALCNLVARAAIAALADRAWAQSRKQSWPEGALYLRGWANILLCTAASAIEAAMARDTARSHAALPAPTNPS